MHKVDSELYINGTGSYVPENIIKNSDLEKNLDTTHEWILSRTGIIERRAAEANQTCSDLALPACQKAIENANLRMEDIGLIIMATITPDTQCPSGANWLQAKLNAPHALTFDITAACSGFIFALHVAEKYLQSGFCRHVLVVASEIMTRTLDWQDRTSCILWGDGAGAAVLSSSKGNNSHRMLSVHAHTDGANGQNLLLPGGGSKTTPISHTSVEEKRHTLKLVEAAASVRVAVKRFADSCYEVAEANGVGIDKIDLFIPHQANLRIIQSVARKLKVPFERFFMNIEKYGNTSSASSAIAFDEAVQSGRIKTNDLVCLTAFGGGLTWGSALIRW